jgi:hypothetical protein
MALRLLQQVYAQIIQRSVPHAIMSWRYLLPKQSLAVRRHHQVFLQAWPALPRVAWWLIALFSYGRWYLWSGWFRLYRAFFKHRKAIDATLPVTPIKQFAHLFILTFAHTIPPHLYYPYRLYRYAEKEWLNFVYNHELPHWHRLLSPRLTAAEQRLITDKQHFAATLLQAGLPVIPTLQQLSTGENITSAQLFQQQSLFIKPLCGSQKRDCFELRYRSEPPHYQLCGEIESDHPQAIQQQLQQRLNQQPLLIQPLLQNHPAIARYCFENLLATIRLITIKRDHAFTVLSAILEIPVNTHATIIPYPINLETGVVQPTTRSIAQRLNPERRTMLSTLPDTSLSEWETVLRVAQAAHHYFPNLYAIGWDLAITDKGVVLIEGNINWGVAVHQCNGLMLADERYEG